jgi:ATP-dependent exoDNAse (exonuclease V) beta subunit
VFVLNVVDGCMPSDLGTGTTAEIEEERRLLYVAMTRAKDTLHLITPHRFFTYGQPSLGDCGYRRRGHHQGLESSASGLCINSGASCEPSRVHTVPSGMSDDKEPGRDETPADLRRKAVLYRQTAAAASDQRAIDALLSIADEYEADAERVERAQQG